jgi:PAS domain S-box-containing protein
VKIRTRLIWAFGILAVAIAAIFLAWFLSLSQQQAAIATITADRVAPLHQLFVIARDIGEIREALPRLTGDADNDEATIARMAALREEADAQWRAYAATYLTPEEQVLARDTHKLLASTESALARLIDLHEAADGSGILLQVDSRLKPDAEALQASLARLVDLQERVSYEEYQSTVTEYRRALLVMALAAVFGIGAVGYAAFLIRTSILAPLSGARQAMAGMAQGQLDVAIPRSDAAEVNAFLNELRDIQEKFSGIREEHQLDRRRVEEFKARLEAVFKHCPFGIFIKDLDGRLIMLNETEARLWGQPVEAYLGHETHDFVAKRDLPRVADTDRQVIETGEPISIEYRGAPGSRYEWLQTVKFPIRGSAGEPIAIGGIDIDVSERKRHEAALRRSSHHLDRAGRLAKIMFWILRVDGRTGVRTREHNRERMIEWCGWDQLPVDSDAYIDQVIHPEDQQRMRDLYAGFLSGAYDSYMIEYQLKRKDGSYLPVRSWHERSIDPITGDTDIFALAQDITEERRREAALVDAASRAESADRAKTDFLHIMSHELRTPLNPIIGFTEFLQLKFGQQGDADGAEYLKLIHQGAHNLLSIINVILEFSRLNTADATLAETEFDLASALEVCTEGVAARAEEIGVEISVAVNPVGLRIRADEGSFHQAVGNILANSLRFTPAGGAVTIEAAAAAGGIRIAVADGGPGFDESVLRQIDKPFVRGGDAMSQSHGGIGLGIMMARKLMELHGGRIEIANRPGGGALVTLVFPASRQAAAEPPAARTALRSAS